MKLEAKFKGNDGSMGYAKDKTYLLQFTAITDITIHCVLPLGGKCCVYKSLKLFLNNWEII